MTCKICNGSKTSNFGCRAENFIHVYCHSCGGHEYEGQLINRKDWEAWVNGVSPRPAREEQLDMFGEAV